MTRLSLPQRARARWTSVRLGSRISFLVIAAAVAGYATGQASQLDALWQIPLTAAGLGIAVTLAWHAADLAQASEERDLGLRVIAKAWFRDTADKADRRAADAGCVGDEQCHLHGDDR